VLGTLAEAREAACHLALALLLLELLARLQGLGEVPIVVLHLMHGPQEWLPPDAPLIECLSLTSLESEHLVVEFHPLVPHEQDAGPTAHGLGGVVEDVFVDAILVELLVAASESFELTEGIACPLVDTEPVQERSDGRELLVALLCCQHHFVH